MNTEAESRHLEGKIALISGAASGIGRGIAVRFAEEGACVALFDIDEAEGHETAETVRSDGHETLFLPGDVTSDADCRRAVEAVIDRWGGLDILVNNAGVIRRETILETSAKDWDRGMAVNVKSVFLLSRRAIPPMLQRGGGAIINISSGWGLVGGRRAALYCASKGAVVQLTRAMALDHGPEGIRVNCICPGDTDTSMLKREAGQLGVDVDSFLEEAADRPIGRIGTPRDIGDAAVFLVSDRASFITGAVLVVDGGGLAG